MKKYILSFFLTLGILGTLYPEALPSVADVFGNMSEDEITKQVQMGQQFLADLEKYGTPEEKAEFEKILLDTLNSMSEQDFQDIQNIAQMVEPHLQPVQQQPTVSQQAPVKEEVLPKISQEESEKIKNLIATIIARIDEILQKIESCKDCKEELDVRWLNRATFSSIKRQIAQLKNNKLAEKLSKADLSEDDKSLVASLESFLKELTEKNSKLLIEDTFGLSDSKQLEEKYLKQTKDIISMFDSFITTLTPKLEKFLSKWDPEALQLAKEAAQKTVKATQDAQDALKRNASPDARAPQQDRSYPSQKSGYRDYESYPDYSQYGYSPDAYGSNYPGTESEDTNKSKSASSSGSGTSSKSKDTSEIDKKVKDKDETKASSFDDIMDSIESHLGYYSDDMANKHRSFLNDVVTKSYQDLTPALENSVKTWGKDSQGDDAHGAKPNNEGVSDWLFGKFIPYTQSVSKSLETDYQSFTNELDSAKRLTSKVEASAKDLTADEIKKVSDKINQIDNRFSSYHDAYRNTINSVETTFNKNFNIITDREIVGDEIQNQSEKPARVKEVQNQFVSKLKTDIGDKVSNVVADLKSLKSNIERKVKRKSKSSKSSSVIMANNI